MGSKLPSLFQMLAARDVRDFEERVAFNTRCLRLAEMNGYRATVDYSAMVPRWHVPREFVPIVGDMVALVRP